MNGVRRDLSFQRMLGRQHGRVKLAGFASLCTEAQEAEFLSAA